MNGAKMANDRVRTRLRSSTNALRILSKSDRELNAMFPAQNRQRAGSTRERSELKRLLLDVSKMIDERTKKLSKLEEDARKIDIVSIMSKEGALKASAKGTSFALLCSDVCFYIRVYSNTTTQVRSFVTRTRFLLRS